MKLTDLIDNLILAMCIAIVLTLSFWSVPSDASDAAWVACQEYGKGPVVAFKYYCPPGWTEV